jgi:peroxiredoxin
VRQLAQLQELLPKLQLHGYQILALTPDPPADLGVAAQEHKLTFTLLSDGDLQAARAFGVAFQTEGSSPLPVPAVFIADTKGQIKFQYVNPDIRVRLDPDVLLAAAKASLR